MSQPAAVSSAICCSVVFTSEVSVVHIDCTETGASPPTSTLPTLICRVWRRGASTGGGALGMPRETVVMSSRLLRRPGTPARRGDLGQAPAGMSTFPGHDRCSRRALAGRSGYCSLIGATMSA